jgi:hypothetical protein
MVREVLTLLAQAGVWQHMPRAAAQDLVISIVDLACRRYDCNAGEILDGHAALGVCSSCRKPADVLRSGMCLACYSDDEDDSEFFTTT